MWRRMLCSFSRTSLIPGCRSCAILRQWRGLSSSQAATALRPFLFAVHPDLFGRHPKERAVNEDSLKRLNQHLTSLQSSSIVTNMRPLNVTFYLRISEDESQLNTFREIRLALLSRDLRATVIHILKSCSLPLDYVNTIQPAEEQVFPRPLKWHHTYYSYAGKANPKVPTVTPSVTLRSWLIKNVDKAKQQEQAIRPITDEIDKRCESLKLQLDLEDIRWDSLWSYHHFCGCLRSFERLYKHHVHMMKTVLKGRTLVFSNVTGVGVHREVFLSNEDVPSDWLRLLITVAAYDTILERLPYMEQRLSELLCNIRIARPVTRQRVMMSDTYQLLLNKLINSVRRCQDTVTTNFFAQDLSHLELIVDSESGPLTLASNGQFRCPASHPGSLLIDFIAAHKDEASLLMYRIPHDTYREKELSADCQERFRLKSVSKDDGVSAAQMVHCCERMLDTHMDYEALLQDCHVIVSTYYMVMQDGKVCFPWDWKGG